ncbi:MAG: hypothetical protein OEY59_06180 [Deltaproteobacteria bacterium]|nr:hypothetical protein [Deltaproteobacteria bacterium]
MANGIPSLTEIEKLSVDELKNRALIFHARGENEFVAVNEAKQRIAESILNRIATKQSEITRSKGDSVEGAITQTELTSNIETETVLDIQLPQPKIQNCQENNLTYVQAIYHISMGALIEQSSQKIKEFNDLYLNYQNQPESVSGINALLRSYPPLAMINKRNPVYNKAAMRLLGLKRDLPSDAALSSQIFTILRQVKVDLVPMKNSLNPLESLDGFDFDLPMSIAFSYRSKPLVNLDLTLRADAHSMEYQAYKTDQQGQVQLGSILLTKVDPTVSQDTFPGKYCPKISLLLGERDPLQEISGVKQFEIKSFQFVCNSFSLNAFRKARLEGQYESYSAFLDQYPLSPESQDAENALFNLVSQIDSDEMYNRFLNDFPNSTNRALLLRKLFNKVTQKNTWEDYYEFANKYSDSSVKSSAMEKLSTIAAEMPENTLGEKEDKLSRLEEIDQMEAGSNIGLLSRLRKQVSQGRAKALDSPGNEDVRVFKMRSLSVPDNYLSINLDATEIANSHFVGRDLEYGYGIKQVLGVVLSLNYDPKWDQPLREVAANFQFRIFGKRKDPFSIALGGTYTNRSKKVKLEKQDPAYPEGTDENGESQFVNTQSESELYFNGVYKHPGMATFFNFFAGVSHVSFAARYFIIPEFSLVAEINYRHQEFLIDERTTDDTTNNDFQEREDQAAKQRIEGLAGFKIATHMTGKSHIQTKVFYSSRDEVVYLVFAASY